MKLNNFFKYFFFIGTVTILILILSEVFLRYNYQRDLTQTKILNHDSSTVPKHRHDGYFSVYFDKYGFRKSPFSCPSNKKHLRVFLAGDSNIAAHFMKNDDHFGARIIKNSINKSQCLAVDTYGVNGLGPTEIIYAIENFTSKKKYDYVIFNIFADNDLSDIVRSNFKINNNVDQYSYCHLKKTFINSLYLLKVIRKISFNLFGINIPFTGEQSSKDGPSNCLSPTRKGLKYQSSNLKFYADEDYKIFKKGLRQPYNLGDRYDIEFAAQLNKELEQFVSSELIALDNFFFELSQERGFNGLYSIIPSKYDVADNGADFRNYFKKNFKKYRERNLINFIELHLKNFPTINYFELFTDCNNCYYTSLNNNHWTPIATEKASNVIIDHIINHAKSTR